MDIKNRLFPRINSFKIVSDGFERLKNRLLNFEGSEIEIYYCFAEMRFSSRTAETDKVGESADCLEDIFDVNKG